MPQLACLHCCCKTFILDVTNTYSTNLRVTGSLVTTHLSLSYTVDGRLYKKNWLSSCVGCFGSKERSMYVEKSRNVRNVDAHCHACQSGDLISAMKRFMHHSYKHISRIIGICGYLMDLYLILQMTLPVNGI